MREGQVRLLALIAYIVLGTVALKRARSKAVRAVAFALAQSGNSETEDEAPERGTGFARRRAGKSDRPADTA